MLFTSLQFAVFVLVCVAVYYLLPGKWRWMALFCVNFVFYADFGRRRLFVLLVSALSVWLVALLLQKAANAETLCLKTEGAVFTKEEKKACKARFKRIRLTLTGLCVAFNLGLLLFFKFYPMAARTFGALPQFSLLVPVGISFYTLQVVSYVIDVYHKKIMPERNPLKMILFTMYFPQIIEGPISRFDALAPQLFAKNAFDYTNFTHGLQRILWGCFKKLVIADTLFVMVDTVFVYYDRYFGFEILLGAALYTIELYADFSGGIDIALGVSELFGIHLAENFNRPFFSKSIPEFWRRWHITLGAWLKDYLFYPLTLSKPMAKLSKFFMRHKNKWAAKWVPSFLALFVLWFCNGVWHGEGIQYILFGLYHGLLVMLGMSLAPLFTRTCTKLHLNTQSQSWKLFRVLRTFLLVCYGELIFRSSSLAQVWGMTKNLFAQFNPWALFDGTIYTLGLDARYVVIALLAIVFLFGVEFAQRRVDVGRWIQQQELPIRWLIYFAGLFAVVIFGAYGPLFKPVQFIYFQF